MNQIWCLCSVDRFPDILDRTYTLSTSNPHPITFIGYILWYYFVVFDCACPFVLICFTWLVYTADTYLYTISQCRVVLRFFKKYSLIRNDTTRIYSILTIYNIQYTIYNIQYTIYKIQDTIYNIQYTRYKIQ